MPLTKAFLLFNEVCDTIFEHLSTIQLHPSILSFTFAYEKSQTAFFTPG